MNAKAIELLIKTGKLRKKELNLEKLTSLLKSIEINMSVIKNIKLTK